MIYDLLTFLPFSSDIFKQAGNSGTEVKYLDCGLLPPLVVVIEIRVRNEICIIQKCFKDVCFRFKLLDQTLSLRVAQTGRPGQTDLGISLAFASFLHFQQEL